MQQTTIGTPGADRDPFETLVGILTAATRYDLTLGIIPGVFAVALLVATAADVGVVQALVVPTAVAILVIVDALYLNPPTDRGST